MNGFPCSVSGYIMTNMIGSLEVGRVRYQMSLLSQQLFVHKSVQHSHVISTRRHFQIIAIFEITMLPSLFKDTQM